MMYFLISCFNWNNLSNFFRGNIISEKISVGPPFYNKLIIPFLIPFLFAMAIGPKLKWIKSDIKKKLYLILFFIISFLLSILIIKNFRYKFSL